MSFVIDLGPSVQRVDNAVQRCWPGYIDLTSVIFRIILFLLLPSGIHPKSNIYPLRHFTVYCYVNF